VKRFTDSNKWEDEWFQDLSMEHKLLFSYLLDKCDLAGIWKINMRLASFSIGYDYPSDALKSAFGDRILELDGGKVWIRKFCRFQYGELNDNCKPHAAVLKRLKEHGLVEKYVSESVQYANPIQRV
jgi:hypothetical protein